MEEQFELPVNYKGRQYLFKAALLVFGFTHKFRVDINGQTVIFEPDEERNYRAIINYEDADNHKEIDVELLRKITEAIEEIVK